jgi:5-hydroxyisourate hydrolase-like protein (transthyretin family)
MKLLALVALLLALGVGVFFVLTGGSERGGGRNGRASGATPAAPRAPDAHANDAAPPAKSEASAPPSSRQAAPEVAKGEARLRYEGTILGEGAPLAGAEIELWRLEQRLADVKSDERGRFKLELVAPNAATQLRIRARGYVALERTLQPKPRGGTEILGNVRLLRGQRLAGRVVDSRAAPVAGAALRVEPGAPGTDVYFAQGTSAQDGSFEIADSPPGLVEVVVRARGYGEARVTHTQGRPLEIRLLPGVDLPLFVADPSGAGIANVEVTILAVGTAEPAQRTQATDAEGRVRFEGLSARMWSVRTLHPDFRPAPGMKLTASGNEETLTLKPWPGIVGTVRTPDGGPPPAGTRVNALMAMAPGDTLGDLPGGSEVAADGSFRIGALRPADWVVRVSAPGFAPTISAPVKLLTEQDGQAGTIVLKSGGKLVLEITSGAQKIAGAEVELLHLSPSPAQVWAVHEARAGSGAARVASDSSGRLVLDNLAPGRVWLVVCAEGYPPKSTGPHEASETSSLPIPVELTRGGRARGVVRTKSGKPAVNAQLRLVERAGQLGFPLMLATDDEGRYTTAWLPPGPYTLEAFSSEDPTLRSGAKEFELSAGAQPEIDLSL